MSGKTIDLTKGWNSFHKTAHPTKEQAELYYDVLTSPEFYDLLEAKGIKMTSFVRMYYGTNRMSNADKSVVEAAQLSNVVTGLDQKQAAEIYGKSTDMACQNAPHTQAPEPQHSAETVSVI